MGAWAPEHAAGQIHIPDKTGTADTGADQTGGEKEAVSATPPTPCPTHPEATVCLRSGG